MTKRKKKKVAPRALKVGPWKKVAQREIPNAFDATWGGSTYPTILYLDEEVTEERKLPDGSFEIRSRRVPVFRVDARELGSEYQSIAVAVTALRSVLETKLRADYDKKLSRRKKSSKVTT
jgi:hypothetical protein